MIKLYSFGVRNILLFQFTNGEVFDLRELPADSEVENCLPFRDRGVVKRIQSSDTPSMSIEVEKEVVTLTGYKKPRERSRNFQH